MSNMDGGSSLRWLSALYCGNVNCAWRMDLPIEFEDVADKEMNKNSIQTNPKMK